MFIGRVHFEGFLFFGSWGDWQVPSIFNSITALRQKYLSEVKNEQEEKVRKREDTIWNLTIFEPKLFWGGFIYLFLKLTVKN